MVSTPDPISLAPRDVRTAWSAGTRPLQEAFPLHADRLLRAIAYAHYAPFPVPILITGKERVGKTTLLNALAELTGQLDAPPIKQLSLNGIRAAAQPGRPLLIDDAAPSASLARPSMLSQIAGEVYAVRSTPLHDVSILGASGDQPIDPHTLPRVIHVHLGTRQQIKPLRAVGAEPATAARMLIHSHLQANTPRINLDPDARHAAALAADPDAAHERRRGAAFYVGDRILSELALIPSSSEATRWLEPDDRIMWALRSAIRYMRANGGVIAESAHESAEWIIGRAEGDQVMIFPNEALTFIRAELGDRTTTTNALTRALSRLRLISTDSAQGGTVPVKLNGRLMRAWRMPATALD